MGISQYVGSIGTSLGTGLLSGVLLLTGLSYTTAVAANEPETLPPISLSRTPLFLTGPGLPPNILLIPDHSESMQEGVDGRVAINWDNCVPGPTMEDLADTTCIAGARSPLSKGSIVKSVSKQLVDDYGRTGRINLGLMGYQQFPANTDLDSVFIARPVDERGTALWRLYHRPFDVQYARTQNPVINDTPNFYREHDGSWDDPLKRYTDPHPTRNRVFSFYNEAIPGYERDDFVEFCEITGDSGDGGDTFPASCYGDVNITNAGVINFDNRSFTGSISLVDSMRQRGIPEWGDYLNYMPVYQNEWRSNVSPGLGYLNVAIGGVTYKDGRPQGVDEAHWNAIERKLEPQRVDWDGTGNPLTDPDWPLIAAGLTPIKGTMATARSYFLGQTDSFGESQGQNNRRTLPENCEVNAVLWVTDGLPSVRADGTPYSGEGSTAQALDDAEAEIRRFHQDTGADVFIVGFGLPPGVGNIPGVSDQPLDALTAAGGTSQAFEASDASSLQQAMDEIFSDIVRRSEGSAASAAASSTSLQTDTALFVAEFDSTDWSGDLKAIRVTPQAEPDEDLLSADESWSANRQLPGHMQRTIISTVRNAGGDTPVWSDLSTVTFNSNMAGIGPLNRNPVTGVVDGKADERIAWLRGDQSNEGEFRRRVRLIGDIVNSNPLYIRNQNFGYARAGMDGSKKYQEFLKQNQSNVPMVMVAANDGKLHAFDGRLPCEPGQNATDDDCVSAAQAGREIFAYVPGVLIPSLNQLTDPGYRREYFFDGSPRLAHVYDEATESWRRIVVTSLGAGGKAVTAIDIDSREVLWEFTAEDNSWLGNVIGDPVVGKAASGEWVTIIPNGVNAEDSGASLLVLDTLTGELLTRMRPPVGDVNLTGSGMFTPVPLDVTGDRHIDRLYAGDMAGNLWRFDLTGSGPDDWGIPNNLNNGPLFVARGPEAGNPRQPITSRPTIVRNDAGDIVVLFGTGRYFDVVDNDPSRSGIQSFYGIKDTGDGTRISRDNLTQQRILAEQRAFGFDVRLTSDLPVDVTKRGWFIDLVEPNTSNSRGERVVSDPIIRSGNRVVFTTVIPEIDDNPCEPGAGTGWVMEMNAFAGSRLQRSPWDLSGDGFGEESFVEFEGEKIPVSGLKSPVGIPTIPAVIEDPTQPDREYKFTVGSDGEVWEMPDEEREGGGRQFWRQLR